MQGPVHPSFGRVKTVADGLPPPPGINMGGWVDGWWTGKKIKELKGSSKTIHIVSYASKVSVNGVTCVFVVNFRSSIRHI